jgi:glycine/D-amino acid oxidase-like deaminating enzyme
MMRIDAVIFGGGVAGLWTLDRLSRQGCSVLLLEAHALGHGQTIGSQGIIHGGLKYSLQGWVTKSAQQIKKMPGVWQKALLGQTAPNLTQTTLRSEACYLWQTESLMSTAGMLGAKLSLQVTPEAVATSDRPTCLKPIGGTVSRLPEQVLHPASLLADLARQYATQILHVDLQQGVKFQLRSPGEVTAIELTAADGATVVSLKPQQVIFTAGAGNARLRTMVGLSSEAMQRRPLHMVLVRGDLPELNGHCIDGLKTRATVTTDVDRAGRRIWQVGGQLAEDGVRMTPLQLTQHAANELQAILPGVNLTRTEWSTYSIDRAEAATAGNARPETAQMLCAGNVTTGWPTKLALAPVLADEIATRVQPTHAWPKELLAALRAWPHPPVAEYPWNEADRAWWPVDVREQVTPRRRKAA